MKALNNFKKFRFLLVELVKKNIKLKYRRSYLGMFWTLLEPIMTTMVLTFVFGTLLKRSSDPVYPVFILIGRLSYSFFSGGSKAAMRSVRKHSGMIKKVYVPKYIYPLSSVLSNFVIYLISLLVLVGACIVKKVHITPNVVLVVVPILILTLLTLGVGVLLSSLSVFFKDLEYLWDVALTLIMYCSAIFYSVDPVANKSLYQVIRWNPLYGIIQNMRRVVIYGQSLDLYTTLYAFSFSVLSIAFGLYVFKKTQDKFILYV